MSFVGPRPERPEFVFGFVEIVPAYDRRHDIKPGVTGLAQIYAGYDKDAASLYRKLRWDMKYIQRMCFTFDLYIMWQTAVKILNA
jgi:lipopolysaccharide/colanic/teichoic acid biosynthesis glycosyltransferase